MIIMAVLGGIIVVVLARERPSDKVSDNRHGQRWTLADTHGRSVPG